MSGKEYPEKHRPGKLGTEKFDWYPRMPMEWFEIHYKIHGTVDSSEKESREPEKKEKKIE